MFYDEEEEEEKRVTVSKLAENYEYPEIKEAILARKAIQ